tara:strand:- start:60 stop:254 length:195 start_codon:yes stop_codon:yes gene_type:complete
MVNLLKDHAKIIPLKNDGNFKSSILFNNQVKGSYIYSYPNPLSSFYAWQSYQILAFSKVESWMA